ncbi:glycosyltransferase family 4 protein [Hymenobacter fodinae]|nr:glycosyltransferase family 4 protein [Hymenobacter fodinae]
MNLQKAGSHVVALTLASGMAEKHEVFYFNHGEQLVDAGMVKAYLKPEVRLLDITCYPTLNKALWKINGLLKRLTGYAGFHELCKTFVFLFMIVRHRIELVHGHEILTKYSKLAKVARLLSVPIVVTDHNGYTMLLKVGDTSFYPYANQAKAIIAVSHYTARVLREGTTHESSEKLRAYGEKVLASDHKAEYDSLKSNQSTTPIAVPLTVPVTTIYNGVLRYNKSLPVPTTIKESLGIMPNALVFGMIARGTEQKGWRFALAAYQQLKQQYPQRHFNWLCMGDGPCIQEIKAELGTQHPDIIFVGNVDDPHYYMSVCDVGIVPSSFSEGLPLSIVEFFEHRVPVIGSDLCGIPEVITPDNAEPGGFLIEMEEDSTPCISSLLSHMARYVDDATLLNKHGEAALAIRRRFDMDQFIAAHEQLYTHVLASTK